jgi:hypothetical protein
MRRGTTAIHTAWQEIRAQLRPGMRFVDVQRIGRESMKKQGADFKRQLHAAQRRPLPQRSSATERRLKGAPSRVWRWSRTWCSVSIVRS